MCSINVPWSGHPSFQGNVLSFSPIICEHFATIFFCCCSSLFYLRKKTSHFVSLSIAEQCTQLDQTLLRLKHDAKEWRGPKGKPRARYWILLPFSAQHFSLWDIPIITFLPCRYLNPSLRCENQSLFSSHLSMTLGPYPVVFWPHQNEKN